MSILEVNPDFKQIDETYFSNYGGKDYSESYGSYTYHPGIIIRRLKEYGVDFKTVLDAGCASGQLVQDFRSFGKEAFGFDNNTEILKKSVCPKYTFHGDIRDLSHLKDNSFEVVYLNSLMYLFPQEILPTLKEVNRICSKAVFLCNPFLGETEMPDLYRTFLAKPAWWEKQFVKAGFKPKDENVYLI